MDSINRLPDAILLKILSSLPTAKDVVATMVLSKRWQFLWMLVPKLVFDDRYQNPEYLSFSRFVDRSLFLHEAPVLETLHFKLSKTCGSGDLRIWIKAAEKCCVRELAIDIDTSSSSKTPVILPRSLYSGGCKMLVTLKLSNAILVDAASSASFASLKNLSLVSMTYPGDEFVKMLLSNCPVLEGLVVKRCPNDNVTVFTVKGVPSLKSLVLHNSEVTGKKEDWGFWIDAQSLESLDIADYSCGFCGIENNMSKIVKADVCISFAGTEHLLGPISSVKHLYLCVPSSKNAYPVGNVFHCLVRLTICTCETEWLNLLMCVLRDSPKLRALKLDQCHRRLAHVPRPSWSDPSSVPECLLSSLDTLEWVKYDGTEEEKEVASFILRSGSCLKKVNIIASKSTDSDKKLEMLKELSLSVRRSPTCQLVFK